MTADVEPHGSPLSVGDDLLEVTKLSVSGEDNNAYLLTDPTTGEQLLIDAADGAASLLELVRDHGDGDLAVVLTTHRHWDHHRALREVVDETGALVLAGADDASALPVEVDRALAHGDIVTLGEHELKVIALRGHTPGSVALAYTGDGVTQLFTGDSLFPGGIGKTGSPEDFASLIEDVSSRVFDVYDDMTIVHPGHGDSTTIGAERAALPQWRERGW